MKSNYIKEAADWIVSKIKSSIEAILTIECENATTRAVYGLLFVAIVLGFAILLVAGKSGPMWRLRLKHRIRKQTLWEKDNFLALCKREKKLAGGKHIDKPGCYIITTYKRKLPEEGGRRYFKRFHSVYVGQSVNVYSRVKAHLTGSGKGDVYADIRANEWHTYVRILPCSIKKLNKTEKELIRLFDATEKGYNKTKGGSPVVKR